MTESLSVTGAKWIERPHDARAALAISQQQNLPEILGRILASRAVTPENAAAFLNPRLRDFLPDPFHLKDMQKAARRIADAITNRETIAVFGDYDVDGATSSALLIRYFRHFGITPIVHIPDRITEGYGPNTPALLSLKERSASLVITVDCGTMAFEPLAAAASAGLDVIVSDHHKSDAALPTAFAIVNPNRMDETSAHGNLAAVGVTFLLLVAVNKLLKEANVVTPDLLQWLDIVALGTICDVVPLTALNHAFVAQGLKLIRTRRNTGIAAALETASIAEAPNAYHAGFIIGPRINAGGRVGKSDLGVRLLASDDESEAHEIAAQLGHFNAERKAIESLVLEEAMQDAEKLASSGHMILVARGNWHPGVIGIVASRLKDHFHKPAAVIALKDGIGKASARSVTGVDIGNLVVAATHQGLLLAGGGHTMAAGFSVAEQRIEELRSFFNTRLAETPFAHEKTFSIDGEVSLQGLTPALIHLIEQAGPFGAGNPSVRLKLSQLKVVHSDVVGENHVRAVVVNAGATATAGRLRVMAFRSAGTPLGEALLGARGRTLDIIGTAHINHWQGNETVDFFVDDVGFV